MNTKMLVAIALIALGVVALAYQGFTYTTRSEGMNIGKLHMSTQETHRVPLPPILGGIALVGGIVLLVTDKMRSGRGAKT